MGLTREHRRGILVDALLPGGFMAKALVGHIGSASSQQLRTEAVLRQRIVDLEHEILRLKAENDLLVAELRHPERVVDGAVPASVAH